jgi:NTE family protein
MSRALVLGGGGPVGIGWESGLVVGLAAGGVDLAGADLLVGTSAGSVVGAEMRLGMDLDESLALVTAVPDPAAAAGGMEALLAAMAEVATSTDSPEAARLALGRLAVESETIDEDAWVAMFAEVERAEWPDGFACTAVEVETGAFTVWDAAAGAPLQRAVASSCAVPGIFPPVTIAGRRYMDGGMRTALNAQVAAGHDRVVAVSCFPLALPEGMSDPAFDAMIAAVEVDLDAVRGRGGAVEVVTPGPELLEISGWGLNLMDFTRAHDAFEAGVRQAGAEAARLRSHWSGG